MDQALGMSRSNLLVIAGLCLAALLLPLPLYFIALACFGLPHVLWELAYLRHTCRRVPLWWWLILSLVLLLQAYVRLRLWRDPSFALISLQIDVVSLALALALVWLLPRAPGSTGRDHLRALAISAGVALLLILLVRAEDWRGAMLMLLLLSAIHNFTPVALARLGAADGQSRLPWLGRVFWLPVVLFPLAAWGDFSISGTALSAWQPVELTWLKDNLGDGAASAWGHHLLAGLLTSLVLAQCLHYYSVLRLLPASLGQAWRSESWLWLALGLSLALSWRFALNFPDARKLYAVAAGIHAWLEWPVLLLWLAGWCRGNEDEPAAS